MFGEISKIHHPIVRTLAAAGVGFATVTLVAGVVVGISRKEGKSYEYANYAALAGTVAGAIGGLVAGRRSATEPAQPETSHEWSDWRDLIVARKVKESAEITSFYLKPVDGGALPQFKPGQFLTIKLEIPSQPRPVIRTYSLSDYTEPVEYYRLSIKREPAPKDSDLPPGVASNFMHDQVQEGTVIPAKPPSGRFVLEVNQSKPAVLISNGVGITPMIAMAKAVARLNPDRHLWFLHGARSGEFHACRDEVNAIQSYYPNLHIYYRYSRPRPEDEGHYHSSGYVDSALIQELVLPEMQQHCSNTDADYFLCGSPSFMDALREGLAFLGVSESQVFFESFSKPKDKAEPVAAPAEGGQVAEVTFAKSGQTATWKPEDGTLLEFAEAQGLNPDFSCRQGICLTCMCRLEAGEVDYVQPPTGTPDEGSVLICISKPKTEKIVLDL